jgi:uncharacterized protein (DUF2235 family)
MSCAQSRLTACASPHHLIRSAYKFLMNAYRPGSKICVFGFSRGAHTARAVVAMVNAVGLLPPHNAEHVPFAFACYKNRCVIA